MIEKKRSIRYNGIMLLRFTPSGHIFISPGDDCRAIVDFLVANGQTHEFCLAGDFSPDFVARMMEAGFLVMSVNLAQEDEEPYYILLPKLHLVRSALFFENLHVKKSIKRFLNRYELRPDAEFDHILDRCVEKHGIDWLTPPLIDCIKQIKELSSLHTLPETLGKGSLIPRDCVNPASFALYRDGKLVAGEFGVVCGKVYTSYSGFYDEDNAGTVQLILTTRYLQEQGFSFFDLGMPMDYKNDLGAVDISPEEFVRLFRG
jgi:Leu/Phe-tRNA-protein transferase